MKNLINLIINPFQFYRDFKEKEEVQLLLPILIIVIMGVLTIFVGYRTSMSMTTPAVEGANIAIDSKTAMIGAVIGGVTGTIGLAIVWVIKSAIYNVILKKMGGHGNFKRTLYITGTAAVTGIFLMILAVVFPPKIDITAVQQSLTLIDIIKDHFNLFVIWELFLLVIGFAIDNEIPYKKAAIPVVVFHLVAMAISIAMTMSLQGFYSQLQGGAGATSVEP